MVGDPVGDLLTQIRNAGMVKKDHIVVPHSNLKEAVAKILTKEGYLVEVRRFKESGRPGKKLAVSLKYGGDGEPTIRRIQRFSKPGVRHYKRVEELKPFLIEGAAVVSTSKGVKSVREAVKEKLGGELLCWVR